MDTFEQGMKDLARAAEQNGMSKMQHVVMRWMLDHRRQLPQTAIDSLMAQMARELEMCEQSPPSSPPA